MARLSEDLSMYVKNDDNFVGELELFESVSEGLVPHNVFSQTHYTWRKVN